MLSSAEVNLGITVVCIPTLLPLYRFLRSKFLRTPEKSSFTTPHLVPFPDKPKYQHFNGLENNIASLLPTGGRTNTTMSGDTLGLPLQMFDDGTMAMGVGRREGRESTIAQVSSESRMEVAVDVV